MTLSDTGAAASAAQYIAESLGNSDIEMNFNFAAAAYAAGSLGSSGRAFVPFLTRALKDNFEDEPLSLESFRASVTLPSRTSCRIEAIRALAKMGATAAEAIPLLEKLTQTAPHPSKKLVPWKIEAQKALESIKQAIASN